MKMEEGAQTIKMDAMDNCFFCLTSFENVENHENQFQNCFSVRSLLHYLRIANDRNILIEKISICIVCSQIYVKFQKLFRQWQQVEIELSLCFGQFANRLNAAGCCADILKPNIVELRKTISEKCKIFKLIK